VPSAILTSDPVWADWSEERPCDFTARFERKALRMDHAPRQARAKKRWTLGATALAAVALPAFAAPQGWDRFQIADAVATETPVEPMPFEKAGASFPGSAFYYLEIEKPVLQVGEGIHSDAEDKPSGPTLGDGPVAKPMQIDNSGVDRTRAQQCLTAAIYYEAASESEAGQRAVAQVVLNRVAHPAYPNTVCGVVYEGSERSTGCQFSFTCDGSLARRPSQLFWDRAKTVARQALAGAVPSMPPSASRLTIIRFRSAPTGRRAFITSVRSANTASTASMVRRVSPPRSASPMSAASPPPVRTPAV